MRIIVEWYLIIERDRGPSFAGEENNQWWNLKPKFVPSFEFDLGFAKIWFKRVTDRDSLARVLAIVSF